MLPFRYIAFIMSPSAQEPASASCCLNTPSIPKPFSHPALGQVDTCRMIILSPFLYSITGGDRLPCVPALVTVVPAPQPLTHPLPAPYGRREPNVFRRFTRGRKEGGRERRGGGERREGGKSKIRKLRTQKFLCR